MNVHIYRIKLNKNQKKYNLSEMYPRFILILLKCFVYVKIRYIIIYFHTKSYF